MTTPAIEARELTKQFRKGDEVVRAVDGIDLTVEPGQIVAFLGPNGAGKTTALDMVLGLTKPDGGAVSVCGLTPRQAVLAGRVSAVLQTGGLLADLTVAETVRLVASTFDGARPVAEVMERAGISGLAKRRVSKCSGGEQQRLRFALALLPDPQVLILDEPTAGMDVTARRDFWATMRADTAAGRTVVFATHYLEEANAFAERVVMIASGRIVADGTVREIRSRGAGRQVSVDLRREDVSGYDATRDPIRTGDAGPGNAPYDDASWLAAIRALPGVVAAEVEGDRVQISATDTDATALALLRDLGATNIEIAPATLDNAFVALTGQSPPGKNAAVTGAVIPGDASAAGLPADATHPGDLGVER